MAWRGRTHSLAALGGPSRRKGAQELYRAAPEVLRCSDPRDEEAVHLVFLLAGLLQDADETERHHCEAILVALIPFLASPLREGGKGLRVFWPYLPGFYPLALW